MTEVSELNFKVGDRITWGTRTSSFIVKSIEKDVDYDIEVQFEEDSGLYVSSGLKYDYPSNTYYYDEDDKVEVLEAAKPESKFGFTVGDLIETGNRVWGICEVTGFDSLFVRGKFIGKGTESKAVSLGEEGAFNPNVAKLYVEPVAEETIDFVIDKEALMKDTVKATAPITYIVTWNDDSYCAVLNSRTEVDEKIVNLIDSGYNLEYIKVYESAASFAPKIVW